MELLKVEKITRVQQEYKFGRIYNMGVC